MKPQFLLVVCFLLIFSTACAPAASDSAEPQSAGAVEASAEEHSDEDADEHGEEDHSGEDADEHGEEDHSDEEHSDEDADEHGHEEEGDGERRELGAHEHGAAELMVAWSGSDVAIDLETPSYNVLGFEYEPRSDEEKALLAESVAALESGNLLQISADAGCTVVSANVQTAFEAKGHDEEGHDEDGHDGEEEGHDEDEEGHDDEEGEGHDEDEEGHEDDHDDHSEEVHSEINVSYNLECEQPENIASLDASELFAQFPNFEEIQAQWVSDTEQSAADLTSGNPVLELQ